VEKGGFDYKKYNWVIGYLQFACEQVWPDKEDLTPKTIESRLSYEDIMEIVFFLEKQVKVGNSVIAKLDTVAKHWPNWKEPWKKAREISTAVLKAYNTAKAVKNIPKYDYFPDFTAFVAQFEEICVDTVNDLIAHHVGKKGGYDVNRTIALRKITITAMRMALVGRTCDIATLKAWHWMRPGTDSRYPHGVLWVLIRRKQQPVWRWELILPCRSNVPWCPVRLFRLYTWVRTRHPHWYTDKRKLLNQWGNPTSVWVSASIRGEFDDCGQLSRDRIANDVKEIFAECGINTKFFQAGALRGMCATHLATLEGISRDAVMDRGGWHNAIVFQSPVGLCL